MRKTLHDTNFYRDGSVEIQLYVIEA